MMSYVTPRQVGDPLDATTQQGPLATRAARDAVAAAVEQVRTGNVCVCVCDGMYRYVTVCTVRAVGVRSSRLRTRSAYVTVCNGMYRTGSGCVRSSRFRTGRVRVCNDMYRYV